jgi:SAM-dependent methyltransferase
MGGVLKLKRLYRGVSRRSEILKQKYPYRVQCNICEWKGRIFSSDSWHPHTICPNCGSHVRHRLVIEAVTTLPKPGIAALVQGKRVLHFAPEGAFSRFFKDRAGKYVTADLNRDNVDLNLNMSDMSGVGDGAFDLVIACDVLEHVPDDSAALREIWRILSLQGWAILTVPQKDGLASTFADQNITTPVGRLQAFGQEDHLRIYGDDFGEVVETHGFNVTAVDERTFDSKLVDKHVLFPPILSADPLATNHRRIYFAQRKSE